MNYNEFYDICQKIFATNDFLPKIDNEKAEKLYLLTNRMLEVNKVMNLTAIKDEKSIILRHYADSLTISEFIKSESKMIDVGCGAGFPPLPLAIFRPDLNIVALDSTAKRIEYIKETCKLLDISNVTAISERAEVAANTAEYRESFDYATARAVASLPVLSELCLPFVKKNGLFIAMKAQKAEEEIGAAENAINKCGGKLQKVVSVSLKADDDSEENRNVVIILKERSTPKEYPRHFSKISKKPL